MKKYIFIEKDYITKELKTSLGINDPLKNTVELEDYYLISISEDENDLALEKYRRFDAEEASTMADKIKLGVFDDEYLEVKPAPFQSKFLPNGGKLYKRVHGENNTIASGETGFINFVVPYPECKFSGAEIIGCEVKDIVNFYVLDTVTNTYSQAPVEIYGANFPLNQFGFDVEMRKDSYENTSNYDASLYYGMELMCAYKNNGLDEKYIAVNFELHEVK